MSTDQAMAEMLACPGCKSPVRSEGERMVCSAADCGAEFPIVQGRPVLIWEQRSLFDARRSEWDDALARRKESRRRLRRLLPDLDGNLARERNYRRFLETLCAEKKRPRVLSIEVSRRCDGVAQLHACDAIELVTVNMTLQPHVAVLGDGHDLPFRNGSFDGVVAHAVVDHVVDPRRVMHEVHRVLRPNGLVYVEAPFLQPVHLGRHDYLRFTLMGVRSLMREFEIVDQGVGCGPGMALAMAYTSFLQSFFRNPRLQKAAFQFGRFSGFWLKYFDRYLCHTPSGMDAAAGSYFLGRRAERSLSDRELSRDYVGSQPADPFVDAVAPLAREG